MMTYRATLTLPPSINRTYGIRRRGFYKTLVAKTWEDTALLTLRSFGFRRCSIGGLVNVEIVAHVYSSQLRDCDAGVKLMIDVVAESLGLDDKWVSQIQVWKHPEKSRALHRLELEVRVLQCQP